MGTYLEAIRMTNCQSFSDEIIEFAKDRVNVIVARNQTGKSVFYKMLKISICPKLFDKEDRINLIRRGCQFAQILFRFSDGAYAATRVHESGVICYYRSAEEKQFRTQYEPFEETIEHLGLMVDREANFIANVIESEQDLMLVNSGSKSNYNIMQMFTECKPLDALMESVKQRQLSNSTKLGNVEGMLESIVRQLRDVDYVDVDAYSQNTDRMEFMFEMLDILAEINSNLKVVLDLVKDCKDYDSMYSVSNTLSKLQRMNLELGRIQAPIEDKSYLLPVVETISELQRLRNYMVDCTEIRKNREELLPICNTLGKLQNLQSVLCNHKCVTVKNHALEGKVTKSLYLVSRIVFECKQLHKAQQTIKECDERYSSLVKSLRESGLTIQCPIKGEVVFNTEECIPVSD